MVYIDVWDQYQEAVEELYLSEPFRTRFVSKYRHTDGKLVLKVFDGKICLKYRTEKLPDLKKFERLNLSLMLKMQGTTRTTVADPDATPLAGRSPAENTTPMQSPPPPTSKKGKKRRN
ncbi:Signal recognition particle protein [Thoreauomyces humboldtii]|nr:Signal recognition particle protein [Thoreauomyces humboldtii]